MLILTNSELLTVELDPAQLDPTAIRFLRFPRIGPGVRVVLRTVGPQIDYYLATARRAIAAGKPAVLPYFCGLGSMFNLEAFEASVRASAAKHGLDLSKPAHTQHIWISWDKTGQYGRLQTPEAYLTSEIARMTLDGREIVAVGIPAEPF